MSGARDWNAEDRTGGAIDTVFDRLRLEVPELVIERLVGSFPADDDNLYWLHLGQPSPGLLPGETIQVDTNTHGAPPFLLEGMQADGEYVNTADPDTAVTTLIQWLKRRRVGRRP